MAHHIIKEEDMERFCPYCKHDLTDKKFRIELIEGVNYKTTKCKCGKNLKLKVNKEIYDFKEGDGNLLIERVNFENDLLNKKKDKEKKKK